MANRVNLPGGCRLVWDGDKYLGAARRQVADRLLAACSYLRLRVVKNISEPSRTKGPSKPGEFPRADTGRLRNSIFESVDEKKLTGSVGTNLEYGLYLEYAMDRSFLRRTLRAERQKLASILKVKFK